MGKKSCSFVCKCPSLQQVAFINALLRQGVFQGTTPELADFVKCDEQSNRQRGVRTIEIALAPLKPAEFVLLKTQHHSAAPKNQLARV